MDLRGWRLPLRVELDGDRLLWSEARGRFIQPEPYKDLLSQFVSLVDGPDDRILFFARRWGTLELCRHGGPSTHPRHQWLNFAVGDPSEGQCPPLGLEEGQPYDPVSWWRYWARRLRAVLRVAYSIHNDVPGSDPEWRIMAGTEDHPARLGWWKTPSAIEDARRVFAYQLNRWLDLVPGWIWLEWTEERPVARVGGGNLFSAIVVQLVLTASATEGLAICSACGSPYIPRPRLPARNRRRFCQPCRDAGAPLRHAQRDCRRRKEQRRRNLRKSARCRRIVR